MTLAAEPGVSNFLGAIAGGSELQAWQNIKQLGCCTGSSGSTRAQSFLIPMDVMAGIAKPQTWQLFKQLVAAKNTACPKRDFGSYSKCSVAVR